MLKPISNKVRFAEYFIGFIAILLTIASVILLCTYRETSDTFHLIVTVTPTPTVTPVLSNPIISLVSLRSVNPARPNGLYTTADIDAIITPRQSVSNNPAVTATPPIPPGMIPYTQSFPFMRLPVSLGTDCVLTPDGDQFVSSTVNGTNSYADYTILLTSDNVSSSYILPISLYQNLRNKIKQVDTNTSAISNNLVASSVGCVGRKSISFSIDGLRLYVAYYNPATQEQGNYYPFFQYVGQIATYTRLQNASKTDASAWTFSTTLSLINPYGSQTSGFSITNDPTNNLPITSDNFGAYIQVSMNAVNGNRMIAVRSSFGFTKANGAMIAIFEENPSVTTISTNSLVGVIQLPINDARFQSKDYLSFGTSFALANDTLIANIPTQRTLAYFKRDALNQWNFMSIFNNANTLQQANISEYFGSTVCLSQDGSMLFIGSPVADNPISSPAQIGPPLFTYGQNKGHVYIYSRKTTDVWTNVSVPPFEYSPAVNLAQSCTGWFISIDLTSRVIAISFNQNSNINQNPPSILSGNVLQRPGVVLVAINTTTMQFDTSHQIPIFQQLAIPVPPASSIYADPNYGSSVGLVVTTRNIVNATAQPVVQVLIGNSLSQVVQYQEVLAQFLVT